VSSLRRFTLLGGYVFPWPIQSMAIVSSSLVDRAESVESAVAVVVGVPLNVCARVDECGSGCEITTSVTVKARSLCPLRSLHQNRNRNPSCASLGGSRVELTVANADVPNVVPGLAK